MIRTTALLLACLIVLPAIRSQAEDEPEAKEKQKPAYKALFNGKSLDGWKITNFGGEGEVAVEDGAINMAFGSSLTGITYKKEFPKTNYELHIVAKRADGGDFFAGTTFPVGDSFCSFIPGGWGGTVMGLSSIDNYDASENGTTQFVEIKKDQWYDIVIRVTDEAIKVWLDGKQVIDQELEGHKISIRPEVELSCPLGISCYETQAKIKTIEYRLLDKKKDAEKKE